MKVRILFFGSLSDVFGRERTVELPPGGVTVADLRRLVAREPREAAAIDGVGVRAAVDQAVAGDEQMIEADQEVAFFSPVSGG